jgi:putative MATE family efflux protein
MGVSVVITQNLGAGNVSGANDIARASLGASTWLGIGVALVVFFGAGPLLGLLNAPAPVQALGQPYLQMLAFALLLDAYNASMASVMRAHLRTRDTMLNILSMHAVHLLLCFPLMRGFGPIPALGLPGFALAMAISRVFGVGIHLLLWRWRLQLIPSAHDWWKLRTEHLGAVLHIGLPGAAETIAYRLAMLVSLTVVAGMGTAQLATHAYATQVMNIIVLFTVAIGFAGEILVGHLIGAGKLHRADRMVRRSLFLGLGVSFVVAVSAAATAPWTLRLFTHDPAIIANATTLLWLTVLLEPGRTCNIVIINALRATGDARFPVIVGAVSMLLVMAGGSWLLGAHFKLGLVGVWIAYAADEWVRGLIMAARWFGRGWVRTAMASRRRVLRQRLAMTILCLLACSPALAETRPSTATAGVHVLSPPLAMPGLDRQRTIRVYLPPGYQSGNRRYPVLYMHDGQNLFDDATSYVGEWGVDESMDALAKSDGIEVIVVGIDHGDDKRIAELSPWTNARFGASEGKQYLDFITGTVKPYIDKTFRTRRGRADTGIMGSSLGALSSQYAIYQYPGVFGKAALFSPSYWFSAEIYSFTAARRLPPGSRLYLAAGDKEGDEPELNADNVRKMAALMWATRDSNVRLYTVIRPGGEHNEKFWKGEFPKAMIFLFGRQP